MTPAFDRLSVRIAAVSVVHLLSMLSVIALVSWATFEPSLESGIVRHAELCVVNMVQLLGDPAAMHEEAESLQALDIGFAVYTDAGDLVTANASPALAPLDASVRSQLGRKSQIVRHGTQPVLARSLRLPTGEAGYVLFSPPAFIAPMERLLPGFLLALFASTVGAVFLARSFARPLTQLSTAVRKLGAGDLSARANLERRDEFGRLAAAFDDMAEQLGHLVRSQQELLANVSHELRTPMARIRVALDLAHAGDAAMTQEALAEITQDLAELERLVADVLQTARLDLAAGRAGPALPVPRQHTIALADWMAQVVQRFRAKHPERSLQIQDDSQATHVRCDPVLLRRVLENLLDNAHKYSDPVSPIAIEASSVGEQLSLAVADHGIGIAAEDLPLIATPFFRTDRSRARRTGGLGLGLSLARRIIEAHGGSMSVDSKIGHGTTVRILLPRLGASEARLATAATPQPLMPSP